jgi:hypothetical protein
VRAQSFWLHGSGWGFRKMLNWIHRRYDGPPIYVTEGGWSLPAGTADEAAVDDQRRMYYANYTAEMRRAIYEDGVDVRGYFAWSLLDNIEWERGYSERFGTVYTDYVFGWDAQSPTNRKSQPTPGKQMRRRKDSSCWLEAVWRGNALVDPTGEGYRCVSSDVFHGLFVNPEEERCPYKISVHEWRAKGTITYVRSIHGTGCYGSATLMEIPFHVSGGTIIANFSAEGGNPHLVGYWNNLIRGINWGDGRTWISYSTSTTTTTIAVAPLMRTVTLTTTFRNNAQHNARMPWLILYASLMYSCFPWIVGFS